MSYIRHFKRHDHDIYETVMLIAVLIPAVYITPRKHTHTQNVQHGSVWKCSQLLVPQNKPLNFRDSKHTSGITK